MARTAGHRHAVAALCAAVAWSLLAKPAAAVNVRFGAPTKLSRMSFDVTDLPAAFFEASHDIHQVQRRCLGRSRCDLRSVAAIKCAPVIDEDSSESEARNAMRLRKASPTPCCDE
ncbi:hypothetical protein T484DRAFT_1829111 [Baffinella frigidus]|nr:hypothetical protein T484DRAFT_1868479 [Cryptophyta sp. CCMP2293]KAJ1475270.1 hypothetical protein T484DRAFT_1829111 [Cryptophyta sp. CCMP2293]